MNKKHMTVLVSGEVQGVGYRAFVKRYALDKGLSGYAENLSDGRVEVVLEGWEDDLEYFLIKLKAGPAHALVKDLEISWGSVSNLEGFYVY
jgi:acylphosphatase